MKKQKDDAFGKSVHTSIVEENADDSSQSKEVKKKLFLHNWRKLLKITKELGSIASLIVTLLKILEELDLF
ncbi:hypothetical protein HW132_18865 [Brasilonema sp. CT11]|nr:hypothetical protein [Brasilonema sp. CT11]